MDITVIDSRNAAIREPAWTMRRPADWAGPARCTAAMLIEERVRAEADRIQAGEAQSRFFVELRGQAEALAETLVARALDAFARGRLLLIVNGAQVMGLEAEIDLSAPVEALFLRLIPLQGG
jgi:hypothetical protein